MSTNEIRSKRTFLEYPRGLSFNAILNRQVTQPFQQMRFGLSEETEKILITAYSISVFRTKRGAGLSWQ